MKKLLFPLIFCTLLWSGCAVSHMSYVRNFRENPVMLDFHFIQEAAPYLPSDLKIP